MGIGFMEVPSAAGRCLVAEGRSESLTREKRLLIDGNKKGLAMSDTMSEGVETETSPSR
jgi:hypothetical protein